MKTNEPLHSNAPSPSLQEVLDQGKQVLWNKPVSSQCCGAVYWWHGFRQRWYENSLLWVRRFCCSRCRRSHTLLPRDLWPRFQTSAQKIFKACEQRIRQGRWSSTFKRQRVRWWSRVAEKLIMAFEMLRKGIQMMSLRFPHRAPLSRFWLTHPTVS